MQVLVECFPCSPLRSEIKTQVDLKVVCPSYLCPELKKKDMYQNTIA